MPRILIVDSDPISYKILNSVLSQNGYQVKPAYDARHAIQAKQDFSPDLILLDWMLPDRHGLELCQQIRRTCTTPVILLARRGEKTTPLRGLELCADDTLTKPFSGREALAHIQAVLRRISLDRDGEQSNPVRYDPFLVDRTARRAAKSQQELKLSRREFDLLAVLIDHAGRVISRAELMTLVWGSQWIGDPRTLDVHIRWLRLKIEEDPENPRYIKTIHGMGYRFDG